MVLSLGTTLRPSKNRHCNSSLLFFSTWRGPHEKQFVFAIRAKRGLTPKWMLARTPKQVHGRSSDGGQSDMSSGGGSSDMSSGGRSSGRTSGGGSSGGSSGSGGSSDRSASSGGWTK